MDKVTINNEIVVMRHAVRKARVAVATKLIKEIKLLNARKHGNENVIEKCKRKANKLTKELKTLKKLKDDSISKFAITNTRGLNLVLADLSVGIKTRIMTRLAFHKSLNAHVEKFRVTFPEYQEYFQLDRKTKRKQQERIKTSGEEQPDEMEVNIADDTPIAEPNDDTQEETRSDSESSDDQDDAMLDSEIRQVKVPETVPRGNGKKEKKVNQSVKHPTTVPVDLKERDSSSVKIVSKLATVKRFHVADNKMENIGTAEPIVDDAELQDDVTHSDEEVDVFAVTRNVVTNNLHKPPTNSLNGGDRCDYDFNSSRSHNSKNSFTNINNRPQSSNRFARNGVSTKTKPTDKQFTNPSNRSRMDHMENRKTSLTNNKEGNEDLHPSWAARKKQQDIINQGFQGKKIVFSDD